MALLACQETSKGIDKRSRTQKLEISHQFSLEQVTNYIKLPKLNFQGIFHGPEIFSKIQEFSKN